MGKKVTDKVTWVGKIDWELKKFHGNEYSTRKGSSYNAYLIRDKKTVLIDTVWQPFDKEFVSHLKEETDIKKIDYIIANHAEIDHSGALPELLREIGDIPIYCTAKGSQILKGHYHKDWNFIHVKTGDTLDIGDSKLVFVEAPMLHWPDSMFTYMTGDNILFSNDAFGQHYATETLFNHNVDSTELYTEAIKYYANILTPFSGLVTKKINEILKLQLPLDFICPSHGIIWKDNPAQIISKYLEWADAYQEDQITIIYDTMWNATRKMAEAIAAGILKEDSKVTVKLYNAAKSDKNDMIAEVFKSKAILIGSSTINNGYLYSIGGLIEMIRGLKFKNKCAGAFGSYGWSGEVIKQLTDELGKSGFHVLNEGHRSLWVPDQDEIQKCIQFGSEFVQAMNNLVSK